MRGETLPNCYKNSSTPREMRSNKGAERKRTKTKEFTESNTRKRPIPSAANAKKGGVTTAHRSPHTCPNGDA